MISQSKYVAITSGVGGAAAVSGRQFALRLFTSAAQMPSGTSLEFTSAKDVGSYFGFESTEYKVAEVYFGYVSNYQTSPAVISFWADTTSGRAPFIWGKKSPVALATLKAVTTGSFVLSMGGLTGTISSVNLSSATSYADVASTLQTAIRAAQSSDTMWNTASVSYSSTTKSFYIMGGDAEDGAIAALSAADSGTYLGSMLGLDAGDDPVVSQGVDTQTYSQMLSQSLNVSNNYGTFAFLGSMTQSAIVEVAQWTHSQNHVGGMYLQRVSSSDANTIQAAVADYDGVALTVDAFTTDTLAWLVPAVVAAATNYNRVNGTQNYMYKTLAGVNPSITTDTQYDALVAKKLNFYGSTQQAGTPVSFYQPGMLQGSVDDMGVYMNELWLKDAITVEFLNYMLAVAKWPANASGKAIGDGLIQGVINVAKANGTILQAKDLTSTQKAYITSLTNDGDAWRDVFAEGYRLESKVVSVTDNGVEHYEYQYVLIYSKGDSIRKVVGTHTLI